MAEHEDRAEIPFDECDTGEVRVLDASRVRLFRTPEGIPRAVIEDELCCLHVKAHCSFPLSNPDEYVSLRDGANREVGLIEHLNQLDPASRRIVEEEIERRYFLPEITAVYRLEGHFGTYDWEVETDRGRRSFLVRGRSEKIVYMPPRHVIITDVLGNRYQVSDYSHLDRRSMLLLYKVL